MKEVFLFYAISPYRSIPIQGSRPSTCSLLDFSKNFPQERENATSIRQKGQKEKDSFTTIVFQLQVLYDSSLCF